MHGSAQTAEKVYPPSQHVEDQLYERGFPPLEDKVLMAQFHAASWEDRVVLAGQFADERYRRLARRIIYIERPGLLSPELQLASKHALWNRLMAPANDGARWRSITAAQREANALIEADMDGDDRIRQAEYLSYLNDLAVVSAEVTRPLLAGNSYRSSFATNDDLNPPHAITPPPRDFAKHRPKFLHEIAHALRRHFQRFLDHPR